jgi:hypothetical protein
LLEAEKTKVANLEASLRNRQHNPSQEEEEMYTWC